MDKLTEFVTNSFVDKEVKYLPNKTSPKLEPLSPHLLYNNRTGSGSGSRSSASQSPSNEDRKTPANSPSRDSSGEYGKLKVNNNNHKISNQNHENGHHSEDSVDVDETPSKSLKRGNQISYFSLLNQKKKDLHTILN